MIKFTLNLKRWAPAAVECYQCGCVCKGCFYNEFFTKDKCKMKSSVIELVRKFGAPNANK